MPPLPVSKFPTIELLRLVAALESAATDYGMALKDPMASSLHVSDTLRKVADARNCLNDRVAELEALDALYG